MGHFRKQMITLLTSAVCNLNCEYCYVPKMHNICDKHKKINVDFAKLAIKDYFNQTGNYYIRFFGAGEPTVAFDEMKDIYEYASKISNTSLKAELQTNGYFDEDIARWINENIDILWVSFDGLPELHDKQRPSHGEEKSSLKIIDNIKYFLKNKNIQVGVRVTITNENFSKQAEIIEYLHSLGVKFVCGAPCYTSTANKTTKTPKILDFCKHFVKAYHRAQELGMFYQTHLMLNFDEKVDAYCRACAPCPHVTTDGHISCCDWALFGPEYLPGALQTLVYGKYDEKAQRIVYDERIIAKIQNRNIENLGQGACVNCKAIEHCAGGCIGKTIVVSNDIYKPSEEWCLATKYLFDNLPIDKGAFPCFHS